MKILMVHPGASWSTADVHNGLRFGLSAAGAQTANYQLDVRIARSARWLHWNWKASGKPGEKPNARDIQYHAGEGLVTRALRIEPDWVLVVSGMYLDIEIVRHLRKCGLKLACLLTESPYDDLAQAEFLRLFHVAWTNERTSVARLRAAAPETAIGYLGHAWHPLVHVPQAPHPETPKHDVLFIGTAFPERVELLREANLPAEQLALYGHWSTLNSRDRLRKSIRDGVVDNERAAELYRAATVNLNLMRKRIGWGGEPGTELVAESVNPRVMELAACGRFFLTDSRAELDDLFGDAVRHLTFETGADLREQVEGWLAASDGARQAVADELHAKVAEHSWCHRAEQVMADLRAYRCTPAEDPSIGNDDPRLHLAEAPA